MISVSVPRMASIYVRGGKIWCRLKDEAGTWQSKPTPFRAGDEEKARRYVRARQDAIDKR